MNVLIYALEEEQGYSVTWHKKSDEEVDWTVYDGMLINVPSSWTFGLSQHWYAVRQIETSDGTKQWYNLDSKLKQPQVIHDVGVYVKRITTDANSHVLLLQKKQPHSKPSDGG